MKGEEIKWLSIYYKNIPVVQLDRIPDYGSDDEGSSPSGDTKNL